MDYVGSAYCSRNMNTRAEVRAASSHPDKVIVVDVGVSEVLVLDVRIGVQTTGPQ